MLARGSSVRATLGLVAFATWIAGCSVPIAANLDERDANLVADALNRSGIDALKEPDPGSEGHYRVMIARDEAASGIGVLREQDLPPRASPGVAEAVGKGSIVPSPMVEHAQYVAGIAGDLERTLSTVDGVFGARVHLSIAPPNPLSDKLPEKPTASVLLKHRGSTPPVTEADVRRLVAGAVSSLRAEDVTVVMVSRPGAASIERSMSHFGPITVTRTSASWLKATFGVAVVLLLGLCAFVVHLWLRLRRGGSQGIVGESV
jgi:type III secretion protein J